MKVRNGGLRTVNPPKIFPYFFPLALGMERDRVASSDTEIHMISTVQALFNTK